MDRLFDMTDKNWNGRFHQVHDPVHAAASKVKTTTAQDKVPDAPPSHSLQAYEGVFSADGYPDLVIRLQEDGGLQACTVDSLDWSQLRHYHFDVFEWHLALWDTWIKTRFMVDDLGELNAVAVPLAPEVPDIVFQRKSIAIGAAVLDALAGEYRSEVPGSIFRVEYRKGKVYWSENREPAAEALARKCSASAAEFSIASNRVVFICADGQWNNLELRTPGAAFKARRV